MKSPVRVLLLHAQAEELDAALSQRFPDRSACVFSKASSWQNLSPLDLQADAIVSLASGLSNEVLPQMTKLRWVQALTSGVDGFQAFSNLPKSVWLTSMRGIHGASVSEYVLLHMLALGRGFLQHHAQQQAQVWRRISQPLLHGKTVAVIGTGFIACELARRCKVLGMHTVGVSATARAVPEFDEVVSRGELHSALARADFTVLVVQLDPGTRGLMDAAAFAAMKPGSHFINVSRGGVCDEDALLHALQSGHMAGAALDVFATEPLPVAHPLWHAPNCLITPHTAGSFDTYIAAAIPTIAANLDAFIQGRAPTINLV